MSAILASIAVRLKQGLNSTWRGFMLARIETKELNIFQGFLQIPIPRTLYASANKIAKAIADGKLLEVKIDLKRKSRSLTANGYLWLLLGELAEIHHTTKEELYLKYIAEHGRFIPMVVKPEAVQRTSRLFRYVKNLGECKVNGQQGIQLLCYYGTSSYDSKEFSLFLDWVIEDAEKEGIPIISAADKDLLLREMG